MNTPSWRARDIGAVLPALILIVVLTGGGLFYATRTSLGIAPEIGHTQVSLDAFRSIVSGGGTAAAEFWPALRFSIWVSAASTLGAMALTVVVVGALQAGGAISRVDRAMLQLNLAFPHLVWAIGLLLVLGQSGWLARLAASALSLIGIELQPAGFPILVRDAWGLGLILHYVSKETPFLVLMALAVTSTQAESYDAVASALGAGPLQRLRHVTLPLIWPSLCTGGLLAFAYILGAYEAPAVLGVQYPRMLSLMVLDFFNSPDLARRANGAALGLLLAGIVVAVAGLGIAISRRQTREDQA